MKINLRKLHILLVVVVTIHFPQHAIDNYRSTKTPVTLCLMRELKLTETHWFWYVTISWFSCPQNVSTLQWFVSYSCHVVLSTWLKLPKFSYLFMIFQDNLLVFQRCLRTTAISSDGFNARYEWKEAKVSWISAFLLITRVDSIKLVWEDKTTKRRKLTSWRQLIRSVVPRNK